MELTPGAARRRHGPKPNERSLSSRQVGAPVKMEANFERVHHRCRYLPDTVSYIPIRTRILAIVPAPWRDIDGTETVTQRHQQPYRKCFRDMCCLGCCYRFRPGIWISFRLGTTVPYRHHIAGRVLRSTTVCFVSGRKLQDMRKAQHSPPVGGQSPFASQTDCNSSGVVVFKGPQTAPSLITAIEQQFVS